MCNRRHTARNEEDHYRESVIDHTRIRDLLQANPEKKWFSYSLSVQELDPLAYIEQRISDPDLFYWEKPDSGFAIAAGEVILALKATGINRFDEIGIQSRKLKKEHFTASAGPHPMLEPILPGGYSFSDHNIQKMWKKMGAARFTLPGWTLVKSGNRHFLTLTTSIQGKSAASILEELEERYREFKDHSLTIRTSTVPAAPQNRSGYHLRQPPGAFENWRKRVNRSRKMIADGIFQKIVISRQLDFESGEPIRVPLALYHLRHRFPGCFNFMIKVDGGPQFIGATPERLISLTDRRIRTEGLAGSISRGESAVEDVALAHSLMECSKDRSEHDFVVEHIRNNLKPFTLRVDHPHRPSVKKLSNVQHLYTPISAEIRENFTIHNLAGSLHPTPAVGGFPKQDAVPYINEIEKADRGWYGGPVGWYNLQGSGEFAVAIRSAWIHRKRARLYAGCGIVKDSEPEAEWNETKMKLNPMLEALKQANDSFYPHARLS